MIADGPPRRVLERISDGDVALVMPEPVPAELRRVLGAKIGLGAAEIDRITDLLGELAEPAPVPSEVSPTSGDPADDRILAASVAAGVEILVSGDTRHLLPLREHEGVRIIRPQAFLAELAK